MIFIRKIIFVFFIWIFLSSFIDFQYQNIVTNEPLSIHILEVNPKKYSIKPSLAKENEISKDTVLNIAKNLKAKAAINGGFFKIKDPIAGLPAGILKIDNKWISLPQKQRGAIGWNNNCSYFLFDKLDAKAFITINEKEIPIDGINRPRKENEKILYLPWFYNKYAISHQHNYLILSNGFILEFSPYDYLFNKLKYSSMNSVIHIFPLIYPQNSIIWEKIDNIVGGTPLLINNGIKIKDYSSEKTLINFLTQKYARTAVGIKENGNLIFLVVDGNDPYKSIGMTMDELRDFLYDLECIYALNFDGGGSSTMVIDDQLINNPKKDEDEDSDIRKVSNAILILER